MASTTQNLGVNTPTNVTTQSYVPNVNDPAAIRNNLGRAFYGVKEGNSTPDANDPMMNLGSLSESEKLLAKSLDAGGYSQESIRQTIFNDRTKAAEQNANVARPTENAVAVPASVAPAKPATPAQPTVQAQPVADGGTDLGKLSDYERAFAQTYSAAGYDIRTIRQLIEDNRKSKSSPEANKPVQTFVKPASSPDIFASMVRGDNIDPSLRGTPEYSEAMKMHSIYGSVNNGKDLYNVMTKTGISENTMFFKVLSENRPDVVAQYSAIKPGKDAMNEVNARTPATFKSYSDAYDSSISGSIDTRSRVEKLKKDFEGKIAALGDVPTTNFSALAKEFYDSKEYKDQLAKVNGFVTDRDRLSTELANLGQTIQKQTSASTPRSVVDAKIAVRSSILGNQINDLNVLIKAEQAMLESKVNDFKTTLAVQEEDQKNKLAAYDRKLASIKDVFSYDKYAMDLDIENQKAERDRRFQLNLKDVEMQNARAMDEWKAARDEESAERASQRSVKAQIILKEYEDKISAGEPLDDRFYDQYASAVVDDGSNMAEKALVLKNLGVDKQSMRKFYDAVDKRIASEVETINERYAKTPEARDAIVSMAKGVLNTKNVPESIKGDISKMIALFRSQDTIYKMLEEGNKDNEKFSKSVKIGSMEFNPENLLTALKSNNANAATAAAAAMLSATFGLAKPLTGDAGAMSNQDVERISKMMQGGSRPNEVNAAIRDMLKKFTVEAIQREVLANRNYSFTGSRKAIEWVFEDYYKSGSGVALTPEEQAEADEAKNLDF